MSSLHSWSEAAANSQDTVGQTAATETPAGPHHTPLHGPTQPGVSASLSASRVMTVGEISHTSGRRCSETRAPTPCLPSLAETK